jgi:hypothetical protein
MKSRSQRGEKMNREKLSMEEAIFNLHNLGLQLNELKVGNEYIHISAYESLLNWSIDAITVIKDTVVVD